MNQLPIPIELELLTHQSKLKHELKTQILPYHLYRIIYTPKRLRYYSGVQFYVEGFFPPILMVLKRCVKSVYLHNG